MMEKKSYVKPEIYNVEIPRDFADCSEGVKTSTGLTGGWIPLDSKIFIVKGNQHYNFDVDTSGNTQYRIMDESSVATGNWDTCNWKWTDCLNHCEFNTTSTAIVQKSVKQEDGTWGEWTAVSLTSWTGNQCETQGGGNHNWP